ncbi:diaminopimelate epimerase [Labrys wisconsinensis]|uniref:Diaminopimelate epimerase n=1 Tax=Labrys wisconsinensis TaxID=425677 RepID=A0ABU0J1B8_9HYPH|nr:diaminopimelate epimerase [Labrys wisconsinensis]MDQ0468050.1 diaminopimelate epimerase [Labrys wisconsinensis]
MSPLSHRPYAKMNGIGNEIVVLDLRDLAHAVTPAEARAIAAREPFDQLMVVQAPRTAGTDAFMRIYNTDGSESGACGNGTRCVAAQLMPALRTDRLTLETPTSLVVARRQGELFTVDMGRPRFAWNEIPLAEAFPDTRYIELQIGPIDAPVLHSPSAVSMGNPHAVFWVDRDPATFDLGRIGPLLENHPIFPERANISLAQVLDPGHVRVRVWERGAGLTRACGSAACAVAVAAARLKRTGRTVRITLPGGDLTIDWRERDDHVLMTGAVELEHHGTLDPAWFADAA